MCAGSPRPNDSPLHQPPVNQRPPGARASGSGMAVGAPGITRAWDPCTPAERARPAPRGDTCAKCVEAIGAIHSVQCRAHSPRAVLRGARRPHAVHVAQLRCFRLEEMRCLAKPNRLHVALKPHAHLERCLPRSKRPLSKVQIVGSDASSSGGRVQAVEWLDCNPWWSGGWALPFHCFGSPPRAAGPLCGQVLEGAAWIAHYAASAAACMPPGRFSQRTRSRTLRPHRATTAGQQRWQCGG